jgi:hypothetical protein
MNEAYETSSESTEYQAGHCAGELASGSLPAPARSWRKPPRASGLTRASAGSISSRPGALTSNWSPIRAAARATDREASG